ncbi:MAG TPA: hypothetical protein VES73_04045 [Lamprocystis sp. (in: g-proteobacteria)]|nr:hypothetical protein [Lamprocystis sp. (in: g-proteobacteria)]
MRIEAELDPIHSQRLTALQARLNKPLPDVLGIAIDAALSELASDPPSDRSSLYDALELIGFIGCIDDDETLAADYKQHLDFSSKVGTSR